MSTKKLSSRQLATLAVLEAFPPKFDQIHRLIEELTSLRVDEAMQRRLARMLEEMKGAAGAVGEGALADTLGSMAMIARRTGGLQTRIRGLREQLGALKINFEGAMKAASNPEAEVDESELPRLPR
ncbi:MAG: hypothetical protein ACKVZ0_16885 [Gemmatimonadales bacterium]